MPQKIDTNGLIYWEGDNITITERDLEWLTRPKVLPPEVRQAPETGKRIRFSRRGPRPKTPVGILPLRSTGEEA